ncbi:sulfite exporter TauE/SafE family protein [Actinomadura sp. KC345]|uniref:sulfite exporter TauE/SafE family protein n=1 Tax=Actinomadura sp. KC345 TaxID=2530371 RepID=UPI00104E72B3|nr:sulfite exporter TauE/SafE family protein [Actinomadura sp. KC345]TDC51677.1 sulfite exporter TauE/SafE family protein [Actinomadura sp. KC345]
MDLLLVGGLGIFAAASLGGATGFGFGLVAAPVLLAAGLPLSEVVAVNLSLALLTRLPAAWQLRRHLVWTRARRLIAGSVPGILTGYGVSGLVDTELLKITAGAVAILAALALTLRSAAPSPDARPAGAGATLTAGAAGGFLGVTTSLNGVPPALLLTRDRVEQRSFAADLTVYFVASNCLALALLTATGPGMLDPLATYVPAWLPAGLLGNQLGIRANRHLPVRLFRAVTLTIVIAAGCTTIAAAL